MESTLHFISTVSMPCLALALTVPSHTHCPRSLSAAHRASAESGRREFCKFIALDVHSDPAGEVLGRWPYREAGSATAAADGRFAPAWLMAATAGANLTTLSMLLHTSVFYHTHRHSHVQLDTSAFCHTYCLCHTLCLLFCLSQGLCIAESIAVHASTGATEE